MARSELARALDELQRELRPGLAGHGFRARARTFHRRTEEGLVQLVAFQMGRSPPPGAAELPGLREDLHGEFTVSLGIWIREAAARGCGWGDGTRVNEADCTLRVRVGGLSGDRADLWWRIPRGAAERAPVLDSVRERLERDALPFLDALRTRTEILARWPRFAAEMDTSMGSPWRVVCAVLHAERGEREQAAALLRQQADRAGGRPSPWLRDLARDLRVPLDGGGAQA